MMQSCASAAKLRSGGPILPFGMKAKGRLGIPPPRTVIGVLSQTYGQGRNFRGAFSVEPNQGCLHSVDDPTSLSDEAVMLAVGPLGILVLHCRDRDHLAVITLAAQPAEKGAFEQLGVETVSLGAPMLARHRHTRCVNDVGSMPRALSQRASQKPSRPASKATAMRSILRPACSASSRHRCSSFSNTLSSTASFFKGWRSTPGTMPATSQLDRLISITAISVSSGSRAVRDRLRSFNFCMGRSIGSHQRRWTKISSAPPHSIFHPGIRGRGGTIFWAALPSE